MFKEIIKKVLPCRKNRRFKFALIAYFDPMGLQTIIDHIEGIANQSRHEVHVINLFGKMYGGGLLLPAEIDFKKFNCLIFHNTVTYNPSNLASIFDQNPDLFLKFKGVKVLIRQDEHYKTNHFFRFFLKSKCDFIVSVLEKESFINLYKDFTFSPSIHIQAHTGYCSDFLLNLPRKPFVDRPMDVVYRGSIQPIFFGWLAYQKQEIGMRFKEVCEPNNLRNDISNRWEDRKFGKDWIDFLLSSKFVLGAESGASIIDYEGKIETEYDSLKNSYPSYSDLEI